MPKYFWILLLLFIQGGALEFKVASYNVENLFDGYHDGSEYEEFIPNTPIWNKKIAEQKLKNTLQVIHALNADILLLQEIENKTILLRLLKNLKYTHYVFEKKQDSAIGLAVVSRFPIVATEIIPVVSQGHSDRNIIKATIKIEDYQLIIYSNHWRSKRPPESKRIISALTLLEYLKKQKQSDEYIVAGDLNSDFDEFISFKYDQKLNDTGGITGINHILNSVIDGELVKKEEILNHTTIVHYNPWLEVDKKIRYSILFGNLLGTPDSLLLPKTLIDAQGISYVQKSFTPFRSPFLLTKSDKIKRWNSKTKQGYSDHLPVIATFTTNKNKNPSIKHQKKLFESIPKKEESIESIRNLYDIATLQEPVKFKKLLVTYKGGSLVVLKGIETPHDRSIQYYQAPDTLEVGDLLALTIEEIDEYFGNKEIKKASSIEKIGSTGDITPYHKIGTAIDLHSPIYHNEIITHLRGIYKKGHLHYTNTKGKQKIKIYFQKELEKPHDGVTLEIVHGILGTYKGKQQIILNTTDDFKLYRKKSLR